MSIPTPGDVLASRSAPPHRNTSFSWLILALLLSSMTGAAAQQAREEEEVAPQAARPQEVPLIKDMPLPPDTLLGFETFTIMTIQGTETFSPVTGARIATTGVVTAWRHDRTGFWIQDPQGDGDPATSDGLYVDLGREPLVETRPAVGDRIWVLGIVEEYQWSVFLPNTGMTDVVVLQVLETGVPLPAPIPILDLPNLELQEAVAFWEPLEGMRVSLEDATIISPPLAHGVFFALAPPDAVPGSSYYPDTHIMRMRGLEGGRVDWNPERIGIGINVLGEPVDVFPGDKVKSMVGVVEFNDQEYFVQAETLDVVRQPRPQVPVSTRDGLAGDVKIVDYNLRDFFDDVDNPKRLDEIFDPGSIRIGTLSHEEIEIRFAKHTLAIIQELQLPHVIVSQEFESQEILQQLGDRVNAAAGTRYRAVSHETSDVRGLEAGFLYDEKRVQLVETSQLSGPEVEKSFGMSSAFRTREPFIGVFRFSPDGPPVTVIACKFKSKRLDPPALSLNARQLRVSEKQRRLQGRVLRDYLNRRFEKDPKDMVLVIGDLGDVEFPEPGETEHIVGILRGREGEAPLTYLPEREKESERYNYLYRGNGQTFAHALASPALTQRTVGVDYLHFNAPFSDLDDLRWNPNTPLRASDRDALEVRFDFGLAKKKNSK